MTLFIPGPAGQLQTIEHIPENRQHLITAILCHPHPLFGGTMENKVISALTRACDVLGVAYVKFNYRGVGESEGVYGEMEGEVQDCRAIIDWVHSRRPEDKLWLMGFSFGSYIAARNVSASPQITQLVTIAPSVEHANFEALPPMPCPWLIIQGEEDEVVPPAAVFAYAEHRAEHPTLVKMPGTSHFFHRKLVELKIILVAHLT
jgi:alpha/beta superfamily hydrolase